jgi:hypothetical protein
MMGVMETTTDTLTGTLFLDGGTHWKYSQRTTIGFRHTKIGNVNTFPTRDKAVARVHELIARGEVTA